MSTKRNRSSVFETIQQFESQDVRADRKRKTTSTDLLAKSAAAKSQTKIHGHLMECRILLQRVLGASSSTEEDGTSDDGVAVQDACNQLLVQLLQARRKLRSTDKSTPNYQDIVQSEESLSEVLQSEYEDCREEWKEVLNRRHKDLRLHAGLTAKTQFRVMDSSFWQQVDATVSHEELRMQVKDEVHEFDDAKVYQHMLQDFVLSAGGASAEEAAAQRLRRAMKDSSQNPKKDVDRRASKGRKIRYAVTPKLVNFTFPVARPVSTTNGMHEDEWFRSLFGGAANQKR